MDSAAGYAGAVSTILNEYRGSKARLAPPAPSVPAGRDVYVVKVTVTTQPADACERAAAALQRMEPPPELSDVHARLVVALRRQAAAARGYTEAESTMGWDAFRAAVRYLAGEHAHVRAGFAAVGAPLSIADPGPKADYRPYWRGRPGAAQTLAFDDVDEPDEAEIAYRQARDGWLRAAGFPEGTPPVHCCGIQAGTWEPVLELEEFDDAGVACGAWRRDGTGHAFGTRDEVIRAAAGSDAEPGWAGAVLAAVERDRDVVSRALAGGFGPLGRAESLVVCRGEGTLLHVTDARNRSSIATRGLDWTRMQHPGVAGSPEPEAPGTFLGNRGDAEFFLGMAKVPSDVWEVDVTGLWLETSSEAWPFCASPIAPDRLRLFARDVPAGSGQLRLDGR